MVQCLGAPIFQCSNAAESDVKIYPLGWTYFIVWSKFAIHRAIGMGNRAVGLENRAIHWEIECHKSAQLPPLSRPHESPNPMMPLLGLQ